MQREQVTPDTREPVKNYRGDDEELAYVLLRYRQCHDFMHTLLNVPTSLPAELALKWFEWQQTGMPMTLAAATIGPLRLTPLWPFQDERHAQDFDYWRQYLPWAIKAGADADFLLAVHWERYFAVDVDELRARYNIVPFK